MFTQVMGMQTFTNTNWSKTKLVTEVGCWVCSNKPNQDGYIRVGKKCFGKGDGLGMLHVLYWEHVNFDKPPNCELNHICKNRGCFNPEHLELLPDSLHTSVSNRDRVGYKMVRSSNELIVKAYFKVTYLKESINRVSESMNIKRSTLSSIVNKNSKKLLTDCVDEYITTFSDTENNRKVMKEITEKAIDTINNRYNLRRKLGCEVQFGKRYSEIH